MKKLLLILPIAGLVGYSFYNKDAHLEKYHNDGIENVEFSSNPPLSKTGAPGESNCTDCHSGTTQSAAGTITYNFSGANDEYLPGQSYTIDLSIASGAKNGFQMTILDANNDAAGTFTAGTNTSTASAMSRNYIRHSASSGITSWSFTWNAPATDMGDLTVYYAFNETNNSGTNSGDQIYLGQESISINPSASMTEYDQLKSGYKVYVDEVAQQLKLQYSTLEPSDVVLNVIDLNGKLLLRKELGTKSAGEYNENIDLTEMYQSGVYFVSLLINNYAINQKIVLN